MPYKEKQKEYQKAYRESHKEEFKSYQKSYYQAHREKQMAYLKDYYQEHKEEHNAYYKSEINSIGKTYNSVRRMSNYYLFNVLKHSKLKGYEIHHCFGYDDYRNFIYIPKALHLQIHQFLRDNKIDADTDHYSKIAHLVVGWDGYVYIKD